MPKSKPKKSAKPVSKTKSSPSKKQAKKLAAPFLWRTIAQHILVIPNPSPSPSAPILGVFIVDDRRSPGTFVAGAVEVVGSSTVEMLDEVINVMLDCADGRSENATIGRFKTVEKVKAAAERFVRTWQKACSEGSLTSLPRVGVEAGVESTSAAPTPELEDDGGDADAAAEAPDAEIDPNVMDKSSDAPYEAPAESDN